MKIKTNIRAGAGSANSGGANSGGANSTSQHTGVDVSPPPPVVVSRCVGY